jgi:hypothetical protein
MRDARVWLRADRGRFDIVVVTPTIRYALEVGSASDHQLGGQTLAAQCSIS